MNNIERIWADLTENMPSDNIDYDEALRALIDEGVEDTEARKFLERFENPDDDVSDEDYFNDDVDIDVVDTTDGVDDDEEETIYEALNAMPSEKRNRILSRFGLENLGTDNESELDRSQADMLRKAHTMGEKAKSLMSDEDEEDEEGEIEEIPQFQGTNNALAKLIGSFKV